MYQLIVLKMLLMTGSNVTVVSSGSTVSVPETQKIGVQFFAKYNVLLYIEFLQTKGGSCLKNIEQKQKSLDKKVNKLEQ